MSHSSTPIVHGTGNGPAATKEQQQVVMPCLIGCDTDHEREATYSPTRECHVAGPTVTFGEGLEYASPFPPVEITPHSWTEGCLRFAQIEILPVGTHPDYAWNLDPDHAMELAEHLIRAARLSIYNARSSQD